MCGVEGEGKEGEGSSLEPMMDAAIEIRRKLNLLLAFIRQVTTHHTLTLAQSLTG